MPGANTLLVNQQICFFPGVVFPLKTSYNGADKSAFMEVMKVTLLTKDEIVELIEEIVKCDKSEEEIDGLIDKLEEGVLDPQISDYIFWDEKTPEEIADIVLRYKPIEL